jgi:anaerobic magnesium-protoporphyrin IX monomethyl ester cyclase
MTDLVLVNPRLEADKYPPLSLLSLAAYVRDRGYSVRLVDAQAEELSEGEVAKIVSAERPLLCGITFMTSQVLEVKRLLSALKSRCDCKFVAGGVHTSVLPKEVKGLGFDYCVVGEGEETLLELLCALKEHREPTGIAGVWSDDVDFVPRKLFEDIDVLPLPAWDLAPVALYKVSQPDARYVLESGACLAISTSRGCQYNCAFCASHSVFGKSHRERNPQSVVDEIEMLCRQYAVSKFFLVDESILGNAARAEAFADEITKRRLNIMFASSARVNDPGVNLRTLKKLKQAGMTRVDFGVESGSQRILNDIRKGITLEQIATAHRLAHEAGLKTTSLMIVGHLEEDWNDIIDSLILIDRIKSDYPEFGPLTPFPATEVYARAMREGWIRNQEDWDQFSISNWYRVLRNRNFDYQEILLLTYLCNGVAQVIREGSKLEESWNGFFHALAGPGDPPRRYIQTKGKFLVMKYLLTRDDKHLRELNLGHLTWRIRLINNPSEFRLLSGLKRNPLSFFTRPHKLRIIRLVVSAGASALRESIGAMVMCPINAIVLKSISRNKSMTQPRTPSINP